MRLLLRTGPNAFVFRNFDNNNLPAYAILSHTWHEDHSLEICFEELQAGRGAAKPGYKKIQFCAQQAQRDQLCYFWVDTCCIDRSNDAELSESINSMFHWYQQATRCYVYLSDVSTQDASSAHGWEACFRQSRWFKRGWTLQELIAPKKVIFYASNGDRLGDKSSLQEIICNVTEIAKDALRGGCLTEFSFEEKRRWMRGRSTKKEEDVVYSMLGLFGVSMPIAYGEGPDEALRRLRREVDKILFTATEGYAYSIDLSRNLGATRVCALCSSINWLGLLPEDLPAAPHHSSLQALVNSADRCSLCKLVLHAATSNYQRSLNEGENGKRYRRFQVIKTATDTSPGANATRLAAYVKELGRCYPSRESDIGSTGTYHDWLNVDTYIRNGEVISEPFSTRGENEQLKVASPEDMTLDLRELKENIPSNCGIYLYGNYWLETEGDLDQREAPTLEQLRLFGVGARFGTSAHMFDSINNPHQHVLLRGSALALAAVNNVFPGRVHRPFPELRADSAIAIERINKWMQDCRTKHKCLQPPLNPILPTRVIDVTESDRMVSVIDTRGMRGRYAALSHSWGPTPRLMATKSTIGDLRHGVAVSFLPETFRDAVRLTQKLGIKYLWIDCLCIIQDDANDWVAEAGTMDQVYSNSYITLSAASSSDSYSGCLSDRSETCYASPASQSLGYSTKVQFSNADNCFLDFHAGSRLHSFCMFKEWLPGSSSVSWQIANIGAFGRHYDPVGHEQISTRAWTLQERYLSLRIVHFCKDQMYFECERFIRSEDGFMFDSRTSVRHLVQTQSVGLSNHGIAGVNFRSCHLRVMDYEPNIRWKGGWLSLIENYSERKLSNPEDKLSAIGGLARILSERTKSAYFAGLWQHHIYEDLCWRTYEYEERLENWIAVKGRMLGQAKRSPSYRAPSWSWASVDGPIRFVPLVYQLLTARVIKCDTIPHGKDPFGRLKGGRLVIDAPVYEVHRRGSDSGGHGIPVEIRFRNHEDDDERRTALGYFHPDDPTEHFDFPYLALFLDPGNAIVLKMKPGPLQVRPGEVPGGVPGNEERSAFLTSDVVNFNIKKNPRIKDWTFQAMSNTERVGLAYFAKVYVGEQDASDTIKDLDNLTLDDVLYESADRSQGPITSNDPKIRVVIL